MSIAAGELIIVLNDDVDVTDREWEGLVDAIKAGAAQHHGSFDRVFVLVASDGGSPTSAQRAYLSRVLAGQRLRASVLSGSMRVRLGSAYIRWFARDLRFFAPHEAGAWLDHIPIQPGERPYVRRAILGLQRTMRTRMVTQIAPWLAG